MHNDSVTWEILGKGKCSFKKKLETDTFCLNEYNVTGLCTKVNCPLSNSVYGTVILDKGEIYLYLKCAEKAHLPSVMWNRILLSLNRKEAFNVIYKEMKYSYNIKQIKKCMKRYVRIKEILKRSRKLILQKQVKLLPVKKKTERRDTTRENKALKAANILNNVEKELLNRLNNGLYGNLYKFLSPKKKIKNKDSELSKIYNEMKEKKTIKKKESKTETIENEDEDEYEEEEGDEDDYEEEEGDEDDYEEEEGDEEDYEENSEDTDYLSGNDEEELSEDFDEEEYLDEDEDDDKYNESTIGDKNNNKKKKKKKYIKEYVDDNYIKNLQENGKLPNDDEIEEMNHNFRKKRNANNNKQKSKKKIRIAYEND